MVIIKKFDRQLHSDVKAGIRFIPESLSRDLYRIQSYAENIMGGIKRIESDTQRTKEDKDYAQSMQLSSLIGEFNKWIYGLNQAQINHFDIDQHLSSKKGTIQKDLAMDCFIESKYALISYIVEKKDTAPSESVLLITISYEQKGRPANGSKNLETHHFQALSVPAVIDTWLDSVLMDFEGVNDQDSPLIACQIIKEMIETIAQKFTLAH